MVTGLPVDINLIEYNSNDLKENENEEKKPIDKVYWEKKVDPENDENDENAIVFRWSDVQKVDEEDIA